MKYYEFEFYYEYEQRYKVVYGEFNAKIRFELSDLEKSSLSPLIF